MPSPEQYNARMMALLTQGVGWNSFGNTRLSGPTVEGRAKLCAYLALYGDGLRYFKLLQNAPTMQDTLRIAVQQKYPEAEARADALRAGVELTGSFKTIDAPLWRIGLRQTAPLHLPVIFMTFLRMETDGRPKVVLWYPSTTQGTWALARFQSAARKAMS